MNRWQVKVANLKHRLLLWASKSYREHDRIVSDRNHWRTECAMERNKALAFQKEADELRKSCGELHIQRENALAAQEAATLQLAAERALRQAADERANKYHEELIDSLKSACNWSSKSLNRRSMYPDIESPDPPEPERKQVEAIRPKAFARDAARSMTDKTLKAMLDEIRSQRPEEYGQVGPEFTSAG